MATYSSILAWKIPWTEKPGGSQSMRLQRVRHEWANEHTSIIHSGRWIQTIKQKLKFCMMKTLVRNESILEVRWQFQGAHNLFLRGRNIFSEKINLKDWYYFFEVEKGQENTRKEEKLEKISEISVFTSPRNKSSLLALKVRASLDQEVLWWRDRANI